MTDLLDGIFFHNEGATPRDVVDRMLDGRTNPRLDDPFAMTFKEMADRLARAKKQKFDAEHRAMLLENEIARLEQEHRELLAARAQFYETGVIDPVLLPECGEVFSAEQSKVDREACKAAQESMAVPDGWQVDRKHVDDQYVYITLKRRREEFDKVERPVQARIATRVQQVIETLRGEFRAFRAPRAPRVATTPLNPAAP